MRAHGFRIFSLRSLRSFSPFPHGTRALSVSQWYLALPDGAGGFGQDFSGPALLRGPAGPSCSRVRGCHPLRRCFPGTFRFALRPLRRPYNPAARVQRFGLVRFRSPLLAESLFCSPFLRVLRCFSSPGRCPGRCRDGGASRHRVAPFGHLRIKGRLHLPAAFRSLPRPSSSLGAKASPVRPVSLPALRAARRRAPKRCARRPPARREKAQNLLRRSLSLYSLSVLSMNLRPAAAPLRAPGRAGGQRRARTAGRAP